MDLREIQYHINMLLEVEGNLDSIERLIISKDDLIIVKDGVCMSVNEYPKEPPYNMYSDN